MIIPYASPNVSLHSFAVLLALFPHPLLLSRAGGRGTPTQDRRVVPRQHSEEGRQTLFRELVDVEFWAALQKSKALGSTWDVPVEWRFLVPVQG